MAQKAFDRSAGILMPISSLPSPYGIGTFGKSAYEFADSLTASGQKMWQVLPLGPTGYGDSPYAPFSAFAGNPYFIDLDILIEEGLLRRDEVEKIQWESKPWSVDYALMYEKRLPLLKKAYMRFDCDSEDGYADFIKENEFWLDGYCEYSACKEAFDGLPWHKWDDDIRYKRGDAFLKYIKKLEDEIDFYRFLQFEFFKQWKKLKAYVNSKGIQIIGDIPIYMAMDSADTWLYPEMFQLDDKLLPKRVAGVPPDIFSEDGQLWGNPIYDWEKMEKDDFSWWRRRMEHSSKLYDVIRIDHFIGMVKYYSIPAEDENARGGVWKTGPGMKLIEAINESVGEKRIIAEDLGPAIPEVSKVLEESGYPGMKVMEFAFDGNRKNDHLPYFWTSNTVAYGGTHDNDTLFGSFSSLPEWDLGYLREYIGNSNASVEELVDGLFKTAYESVADIVVFQMQDVLKIGSEGRTNRPSTIGGNWCWRMKPGQFGPGQVERLRYLCDIYGR